MDTIGGEGYVESALARRDRVPRAASVAPPARSCPLTRPASIRLVVLDWDGTLMDSIGTIVACTEAAIGDVPGAVRPPQAKIREAIGLGLLTSMQRFFPHGDLELFEAVAEAYRLRWRADFKDRVDLLPGAAEAVRGLAESGYLLGVATAKG
ncbi:MAG: HAD family hydrolase, partial [Myxococcota bacterium]